MTISIRSVEKTFGRFPALNDVSLDIRPGELLALLGPSGSGKTTLLRAIAGLEYPDTGQILFDGQDVTYASAASRRVGFVFQQYALFKHMTVERNVAFGLDVRKGKDKPPKSQIEARVDELLRLVELGGLSKRYPSQLSGGQRQRVALARALAVSPRVLLLDEPFEGLAPSVIEELFEAFDKLRGEVAMIIVEHNLDLVLALADRAYVLERGSVVHQGPALALREDLDLRRRVLWM